MRSLFIFITLFHPLVNSYVSNGSYVKIEYIGETDKPVTSVVFYVDHYEFNELDFVDTFRINQFEFSALKKRIKGNSKIFSKKEGYYVKITVCMEGANQYFYIRNKANATKAINEIKYDLRNSVQKKQIEKSLTIFLKRILVIRRIY